MNWEEIFDVEEDINGLWKKWKSAFFRCMEQTTSKRKPCTNKPQTNPRFNSFLAGMIRRRNRLFKVTKDALGFAQQGMLNHQPGLAAVGVISIGRANFIQQIPPAAESVEQRTSRRVVSEPDLLRAWCLQSTNERRQTNGIHSHRDWISLCSALGR